MYTKTKSKSYLLAMLLYIFFYSCSNIGFELPQGPQGNSGKSAYEIWKEEVKAGHINWTSDKVDLADFLVYIKGEKGDKGENGLSAYEQWKAMIAQGDVTDPHNPSQIWPPTRNTEPDFWNFICGRDGVSPYVGDNGNWWINNTDTKIRVSGQNGMDGLNGKDGLSAYEQWKLLVMQGQLDWPQNQTTQTDFFLFLKGQNGTNGVTPHVGANGNWYIGSTDTGVSAKGDKGDKGDNGLSPYVGNNGNWWVGTTDTGVAVKGKDGLSPYVGENGNWWIGETDTQISAKGQDGSNGSSAYELWAKDVESGKILDKNGQVWPEDKNTLTDFYVYLSGANGDNGKSAYELWKETVSTGNLNDPKNPGQKWPTNRTSENDFFDYLTGKAGENGTNGLSAYEVWKDDLARRCNTPDALTDYKDGSIWDCEKNTITDFYEYLRGKDGQNGKDGKPGEPGKPGATVEVIKGIPNVIAQYSQSEFGEYVRTTDGGVLYRVYDEAGEPAPYATVKGMPGLDAQKTYTANDKGEFIIPKEDLPQIQSVDSRWGIVKEVTLQGSSPKASAKNTYVPNRVQLRIVLRDDNNTLYNYQFLYFNIQRKMNPDDDWQNLPSYLPNSGKIYLDAYKISDKNTPSSILKDQKLNSNSSYNGTNYYIYTYRFIQKNPMQFKNNQDNYWDGSDVYYTVKSREPYYGDEYQWNGVCLLAPYQVGPTLKKIKLKTLRNGESSSFDSAEGELDFSNIDFTKIYKYTTTRTVGANGAEYVTPNAYTEEEARALKMASVYFKFTSTAGTQEASSSNNPSSANVPTFKVLTPFLNSYIFITNNTEAYFYRYNLGYLRKSADSNTFFIEKYASNYELPTVEVTYEE